MTSPPPSAESATTEGDLAGLAVALGRIPSGLFVITWREGSRDCGMLASWVMQAGFTPPMVTVAVAPGRTLLAAIDAGTPFVVNVLADTQRFLLARFGRQGGPADDPFGGLAVGRAPCGAATIGEAAAWLECSAVARMAGGVEPSPDHTVVLARVTSAGFWPDAVPLVHLRKNGLRY